MSDLISREALLEAWKIQLLNEGIMFQHDVVDLITNAPTITPQQPQSVVVALEEAAMIVYDYASDNFNRNITSEDIYNLSKTIRTLIKRNTEGVGEHQQQIIDNLLGQKYDHWQESKSEIKSLRQQLAVKYLEVMKLREVLGSARHIAYSGNSNFDALTDIFNLCDKAISTDFTPDNLMAWLGEPVAYTDLEGGFMTKFTHSQYQKLGLHIPCCTPLYAPKLDMKG
jgi:hypothetical protein